MIFVSCGEEIEQAGGVNSRVLTMELNTGTQTEAGVDDFNENKINNVSVFFFEDVNDPCIYLKRNLRIENDNTLKVDLTSEVIGKTCQVYVVANYTSDLSMEQLKKMNLAEIQNVVISTDFNTTDTYEPYFVMHGLTANSIEVTNGGDGGTVLLKRVSSKIVLQPNVAEHIVSGGITYTPDLTKMTVELVNVAKKAVLSGGALPEGNTQEFIPSVYRSYYKDDETESYVHIPLYSYPNEWVDKEGATETYLNFCIPWYYTKDNTQLSTNYYYRVAIGSGKLESNKLYRIIAHIELLGSIDPKETQEVTAEYKISDWKTVDISADIDRYAYLELETNYQEMKNENRVDIGFTSSSETTAKIVKITYPNYSTSTISEIVLDRERAPVEPGDPPVKPNIKKPTRPSSIGGDWDRYWEELREYNQAMNNYNTELAEYNKKKEEYDKWANEFKTADSWINIYGQTLTFTHALSDNVYVPYTYEILVQNADGEQELLTVKQYPPIYILGESNEENGGSNRFIYGTNTETQNKNDDDGQSLGGVSDYLSGSNSNPNQYTIYVTLLDNNANYIIGDPRNPRKTSLTFLQRYGGLQEYLKTRGENEGEKEWDRVIAPAYKIASSWGVTYPVDYEQAQKRCASYQENGYPAGRWRIPTEGEIEFIVNLSDNNYIPELFDGDYFASSGRYYTSGRGFSRTSDKENEHAVRCVYDVWYWGDDKIANPNVFTWGDKDPIRPAW